MKKRRSPYDVMADIQLEILNNPDFKLSYLQRKTGANWRTVDKVLSSLDRTGLFNYKR